MDITVARRHIMSFHARAAAEALSAQEANAKLKAKG